MKRFIFLPILLLGLLGALNVQAQSSKQSNMAANSTVNTTCIIKSLTGLGFGTYVPMSGSPATASNTLTFNCTKGVSYTITPNTGLYSNALRGTKGSNLAYSLYSDPSMSTPFGVPSGSQAALPQVGQYICFSPSSTNIQPQSGTYLANNAGNMRYFTTIYSTNSSVYQCSNIYKGWYMQVVASNPVYYSGCTGGNCGTTTVSNTYSAPSGGSLLYVPILAQGISGVSSSVETDIVKTIYGKIVGSQDVQPDVYNDVVTLTIAF